MHQLYREALFAQYWDWEVRLEENAKAAERALNQYDGETLSDRIAEMKADLGETD